MAVLSCLLSLLCLFCKEQPKFSLVASFLPVLVRMSIKFHPPTPYQAHDPSQAHLVSLSHDGEFSAENWNSSKMAEVGPINIGLCFLDPSVLFSRGLLFRLCLGICETRYSLPFFGATRSTFCYLQSKHGNDINSKSSIPKKEHSSEKQYIDVLVFTRCAL